jgi:hypothetical protein
VNLGPIVQGGRSILLEDLTHATSGLPLYPAFDTGWRAGDIIIAPEPLRITRHSGGPYAGYSFYASGDSGIDYYVTHLNFWRARVGARILTGGKLGAVGHFVGARVPHAHVGINVERIFGKGKQLKHHTNYTHGAPTIGKQLVILPKVPLTKWPIPIPKWFWAWAEWKLGGSKGQRPSTAPRIIPPWAWLRLKALIDNRR